jgi:short-subunit dehydrogenase
MHSSLSRNILIIDASAGIGRELALSYASPGVPVGLARRDIACLNMGAEACRGRCATVVCCSSSHAAFFLSVRCERNGHAREQC